MINPEIIEVECVWKPSIPRVAAMSLKFAGGLQTEAYLNIYESFSVGSFYAESVHIPRQHLELVPTF